MFRKSCVACDALKRRRITDAGMMLVYLAECKPPYMRWGCFLAEQPVITKYILETDGTYGPYLKCNPRVHVDPKTGTAIWEDTTNFDCTYGNNVPYNGITGGCACARANKTVGIDPVLHNMNCTAVRAAAICPATARASTHSS
eukprot:SAG31_NODE_683_length_12836_cov_8.304938_2_plen_143_part_00